MSAVRLYDRILSDRPPLTRADIDEYLEAYGSPVSGYLPRDQTRMLEEKTTPDGKKICTASVMAEMAEKLICRALREECAGSA